MIKLREHVDDNDHFVRSATKKWFDKGHDAYYDSIKTRWVTVKDSYSPRLLSDQNDSTRLNGAYRSVCFPDHVVEYVDGIGRRKSSDEAKTAFPPRDSIYCQFDPAWAEQHSELWKPGGFYSNMSGWNTDARD